MTQISCWDAYRRGIRKKRQMNPLRLSCSVRMNVIFNLVLIIITINMFLLNKIINFWFGNNNIFILNCRMAHDLPRTISPPYGRGYRTQAMHTLHTFASPTNVARNQNAYLLVSAEIIIIKWWPLAIQKRSRFARFVRHTDKTPREYGMRMCARARCGMTTK